MKPLLISLTIGTVISVQASDLFFQTQTLIAGNDSYEPILKNCGTHNNCPDLQFTYADSSNNTINYYLNQQINKFFDINTNSKNGIPSEKEFDTYAKKVAQQMLEEQESIDVENMITYSFSANIAYQGHYKNIEIFNISTGTYTGGAHGMATINYYMFKNSQHLKLEDILFTNQTSALTSLAKDAFKQFLIENGLNDEDSDFEFKLTDNYVLTDKGLNLLYQPYEITAYALGMPEFTIPYTKLKGIIKDEYLP